MVLFTGAGLDSTPFGRRLGANQSSPLKPPHDASFTAPLKAASPQPNSPAAKDALTAFPSRLIGPNRSYFRAMIRKGCTRTVLVIGPFAVKLATDERGRRCNRFEADLYERVDARRRAMLCPVLVCTPAGTALLMPAARPLTEKECADLIESDRFPDWDYMPPNDETAPFEYKHSDWGWLNGHLVALDYSAPVLFPDPPKGDSK
jgi:hypothetical protein